MTHTRSLNLPVFVLALACSGCDPHGNDGTVTSATDGGPASTTGASSVGSSGSGEPTGTSATSATTEETTDGATTGGVTSGADDTTGAGDPSTTGTSGPDDTTDDTTGETGGRGECGDGVAWIRHVPNEADGRFFRDLVVDEDDNVIAVGNFWKQADFGGGALVTEDPWAADGFVVKYGPQGELLWNRQIGGVDEQRIRDVALAGDGSILVTGTFRVKLELAGALQSAGLDDGFVARLSPTGEPVWSRRFGGAKDDAGIEVAGDGNGDVVLVAQSMGPLDFGDGPLGQGRSAHVVKFDADGGLLWHRAFNATVVTVEGVAVDPDDDIVVSGEFKGSGDFGAGPVASADAGNIFIVKLNPEGGQEWFLQNDGKSDFGDPLLGGIATDDAGNIHLGGWFSGTFGFGGPMLQGKGEVDAWIATLNPNGGHVWSSAHGSGPTGWQFVSDVATNNTGQTAVAGSFMGSIAFGSDSFATTPDDAEYNAFAARFDQDGAPTLARAYGDVGLQYGDVVELGDDGSVWLGGMFETPFAIGDEQLVPTGADGYLVRLCP